MEVEILNSELETNNNNNNNNIRAAHYTTTIPVMLTQFQCIQEISATEFSRF